MQLAVLSTTIVHWVGDTIDIRDETILKFPSYEEASDYVNTPSNDNRYLVILRDDRVLFLEETVSEDEYCDEDRPIWFCFSKEDWLASLQEFIPTLSLPGVLMLAVDRFHGEWLNEDFSAYEKPEDWEVPGTEIWRSGDYISVKVGFYNDHSGNYTCSANFLVHSPLPVGE